MQKPACVQDRHKTESNTWSAMACSTAEKSLNPQEMTMSIESYFERIAIALEAITVQAEKVPRRQRRKKSG